MFHCDNPRVDYKTTVDWFESRKFLKSYFPVDIRSDYASFEISSGFIRRPIHENTSWDQARHEVCGHRFCNFSEP